VVRLAISNPLSLLRLPFGKPWQSQKGLNARLLRRFAPRNDSRGIVIAGMGKVFRNGEGIRGRNGDCEKNLIISN